MPVELATAGIYPLYQDATRARGSFPGLYSMGRMSCTRAVGRSPWKVRVGKDVHVV